MTKVPSPIDFAALTAKGQSPSHVAVDRALRLNYPSVVRTCENLGLNVGDTLSEWIEQDGLDVVRFWIAADTPDSVLVSEWKRTRSRQLGLLASFVQEEHLCRRGEALGSYFRAERSSLAEQLLWARRRTAQSLGIHAYAIPFHRPFLLVRTIDLTIVYLKSLLQHDRGPEGSGPLHQRTGRELGKMIVTRARFAPGVIEDLELARELLREAAEESPDYAVEHLSLFLEACLDLYHLSGQRHYLEDAVHVVKDTAAPGIDWPAWHLNESEVWLVLIETAQTEAAREAFLGKSEEALHRLDGAHFDLPLEVRFKMLEAFLRYLRDNVTALSGVGMRGIKLPHGLRTSSRVMPSIFFAASDYLASALRDAANRGQYVYRDFLAELLSYVSRQVTDDAQRQAMLAEAIRLRGPVGNKAALEGTRSALAQAADHFELFKATSNEHDRLLGIEILISESRRDSHDPDPLVLLARDVELNGAASIPLRPTDLNLVSAVRAGNSQPLYELAAQRAALSPDVRSRGIGGRGGAVTVEDYLGLTGQAFVFKRMSELSLHRDELRGHAIAEEIASRGLSHRFGVIEHLMQLPGVAQFELQKSETVSVRRFVSGRTLRRIIETEPSLGKAALGDAADFLAFFHALESVDPGASAQGDIRSRELGRWLKRVFSDPREASSAFDSWIELVREVPLVRRRDAHSLNWLVDVAGRVLAVDLDSVGVRPLGYELAQLTDDHPVFAPSDDESRAELVLRYASALQDLGFEFELGTLRSGYVAGLGARAVGLVTDPVGSEANRMHGLEVLRHLARLPTPVGLWAKRIDEAWIRKAGLIDTSSSRTISQAERRRISRAMAFHLRHDKSAPVSREGWIFADDLAEILRDNGHNVTPEQLVIVAGAHGEPRFELDGKEIRAAYGHTRPVQIEYSDRKPPPYLYHATPRDTLAPIFEARAGLSRMTRQFVHLNDDAALAIQSASRHGQPVFVLRVRTATVQGIVHAASHTWLAPKVDVQSLEIMTPRETSELQ